MMSLKQKILSILMIVISFIVLVGTIISAGFSTQYEIEVGGVCPEDIYATRNITDTVTTTERRNLASSNVEDIYITDFSAADRVTEAVNSAVSSLKSERSKTFTPPSDPTEPEQEIAYENTTYLSDKVFQSVMSLADNNFRILAENTPAIIQKIMTEGVTDTKKGVESFMAEFEKLNISDSSVLSVAQALCAGAIEVNKTFDEEETNKQKELAANRVPDVTYMKNQEIARRGQIITEAQYAMLKEMGFVQGSIKIDIFHTVSVISLLLLSFGLAILYYITIGKRDIIPNGAITSIICSLLSVAGSLLILFSVKNNVYMIYILPLSMIPALISLLLSANLSCVVNVTIAVLAGIQTGDLSIAISIIIAGAATAYVFGRVRRRSHMLYATILSAFAYGVSFSAVFIDTTKSIVDVFLIFILGLTGGFLGGILTIGTLPFWEAIFDVITPMKLGELSNPEHKLLKMLLLKAPGSYHHSLTVANMADAAAVSIRANALLARVGAYYHDIGKIENPSYFKENQFASYNPHDFLPPEESAEIILKHVSDGAKMASQYRLPSAVKDIIIQHHGTTTASYFLYKARQNNPDTDPTLFTYPGPAPLSKEATIIMLADACEAAVRAMREKGDVDASKVIGDIVTSRIAEGQLANSALTFSDLEKVKASFVKTLDQYFHKRILYPQNEQKD